MFPSLPNVMHLKKHGGFTQAHLVHSKLMIGDFIKEGERAASFQDAMRKIARTLPQLLKYLPDDKA